MKENILKVGQVVKFNPEFKAEIKTIVKNRGGFFTEEEFNKPYFLNKIESDDTYKCIFYYISKFYDCIDRSNCFPSLYLMPATNLNIGDKVRVKTELIGTQFESGFTLTKKRCDKAGNIIHSIESIKIDGKDRILFRLKDVFYGERKDSKYYCEYTEEMLEKVKKKEEDYSNFEQECFNLEDKSENFEMEFFKQEISFYRALEILEEWDRENNKELDKKKNESIKKINKTRNATIKAMHNKFIFIYNQLRKADAKEYVDILLKNEIIKINDPSYSINKIDFNYLS